MTTSTSFAQVANNLLNLLQGYSKTIRLLLVMFLTLAVSASAWGAEGDVLKTYDTNSSTFASGYSRKTGDNFVWWGQKGYYGANNATNHGNLKPTAADLPVVKAQYSSATTSTTGYYYLYTSEAVANVGKVEVKFTAKSGSSTVNAYIVSSSTKAASGSATWTKVTLASNSSKAQGANVAAAATYTFTFDATETDAKYYGVVFVTSSYWRATNLTFKLYEGAPAVTEPHTVTLNAGPGTCAASVTEASAGAGVTLPTPTLDGCGDWEFAGWKTTSAVTTETTTEPTLIAAGKYMPSDDITLYAVYQRTETPQGGGSVTPQTDEVTISDFGSGTSTRTYSATYADWTWAKNSGNNIATYDEIRLYASHSMKISPKSGYTISSIVATCTSSNYASALAGSSLSGADKSLVSGSTVTITPTSGDIVITQAAQSRVSKFTVTYSTSGGGSTTYYHSTPDCGDPCASLQAPNVTATATENSITLSWAAVPDATSYNVYNYTTEDLDETTSLTYTFTGLSSETEYEWGVESAKGECFKETRGTTTTQETCTDAVNVMKGTPSNGSFTMVSGYQSTCNGPVTVTLSNIEPATGYQFSAITQTGINSGVTIDNNNKTVTYAQNTSGTSTINVTFIEIPKYTVTLNPNYPNGKTGTFTYDAGELVDGNLVFTYDYNTASKTLADLYTSLTLDGYEFGGWYNAKGANPGEVSGSKCTTTGTITGNKTYYAKWSKLYTITLSENGTPTTPTTQTSTSYTLPTELSAGTCQDDTKELVGWSTVAIPNPGDKPTSNFYELGETVTLTADQTTFYAVFATAEETTGGTVEATLSFASTAQRTSWSTSKQVWEQNGVTFTHDKASGDNIVNNYAPIRCYKNSKITITHTSNEITKIVFDCNSNEYATALENSIGPIDGVAVSKSDDKVTVLFTNAVTSFAVTLSSGQVRLDGITVTAGGGTTTTYSDYTTTCEAIPDPVWGGAVINRKSIKVDCGSMTKLNAADPNGPATISFPAATNHTLTYDITVTASEGFFVSTNKTDAAKYGASVTVSPNKTGDNAGKITQNVYVVAVAPAMSDEDFTGTITLSGKQLAENQVIDVTAYVTCTTYTLTLDDRGTKTTPEYYAGASVPKPEDPTGVCTDPINYVFDGWSLDPVTDENTTSYEKVTFPFDMPAEKTTLYAVYRWSEAGGGDGDYHLVEKALDDWSGDYLIAYSDQIFANGTIGGKEGIGAAGEKVDLSSYLNNNTIPAVEGDKYKVSLEAITDGYLLKTQDGKYNYQSSNTNGLEVTTNKNIATNYKLSVNFVSFEKINLCLSGNAEGAIFQYNPDQQGYFRFYKNGGQQPVYLYKKADGTTYYTTSPVCGPHLAITDGKDIYVTGGNAGGTRDLVIAQQKVSYKATRLNVGPTSQVPDVKVATNGITVGGVVTTDVKVTIDQTKEQQTDGTYTITGTITVQYQPSANNKQEDIQVQLAVDYNAEARDNFTVHARSLPSEFVIVAKSGDKWYALNGDMNNGSSANPANGQVTLDSDANPTKATYAPCNAIYTFDGVPNTGDRTRVRFQGTDGAWLWAASGTNVGIQNKSLKDTPEGNNKAYNWKIETEDNITYKFHNDNNSRLLGLNGEKFGMYASGVQEFRILPYVEKCLYNYAPTNLKVSVLKGTSVTLTWDAVAGATKYQYSTDATNWTDAGTEPTVTINGLKEDTDYIYYIRAYHADDGVSQECIDYAEITFTTADCDDVPTNITYTADLNSITVSWTAAAPTAIIKLYLDENGEHAIFTQDGTTSPWKISTLSKNTTYYLQIFSNGTCASPIVPVKTEDVEVDIVEWQPQGIVVDINTNERVKVTLENEVSFGSGTGTVAEDLFFSKYFEATGNVKLLALYNGTNVDIDLTQYSIKISDIGKDKTGTDYTEVAYSHELKLSTGIPEDRRTLKAGQELIMISYANDGTDDKVQITNPDGTTSDVGPNDYKVLSCAAEHKAESGWDKYVRVTSPALNFSGNDVIALFKNGDIIDVIGAGNNSKGDMSGVVASSTNSTFMDAAGWYNANGYKITLDNEIGATKDYALSTNRCLLIRRNEVVSGANAVMKNKTNFVTLGGENCEWMGYQIPDTDGACDGFMYVGKYDYADYYTKYVSMNQDREFEANVRNEDGTLTVPITDLYKQSCRNIKITLKDAADNVLKEQPYKVPIMITSDQTTAGQAFLNLQENLATVEVDGSGNPTGDKTNLTLEQVREICKTCDVVVRDNATLTKVADGTDNDHPQVRNVYVYEGASIVIPDGENHNYTINGLSLRRKGDVVASAQVQGTGKFVLPADEPVCLDLRVDANNWHWFTLPYDCLIEEVTWVDGTPAKYNTDWFLMYYDGKSRAASTNPYDNHWKVYEGTKIEAGKGYIVGITGDLAHPNYTFELRFPMAQEVLTAEQTRKTVPVNAWGVKSDNKPNNLGWNLVGNPYLNYYNTADEYSLVGLPLIKYTSSDLVVGEFYEEENGNIPFLVTPIDGGWYEYRQELASEVNMMPFTAYFVQVGDPDNQDHTDGKELNASFEASNRGKKSIVRRAPAEIEETEEPIIVRVELTNSKGESDKTSLVIDDRFTNEYEMNGDFFKWFGDYYNYYTKPVLYTIGADQGKRAFNALNEELAKQPIPMGMYAAQAGNYTFSLNQQFDLSRVEEVWLYDATQSTYTNLMQSDYTFSTSKVNGAGRFSLSVKLAPKVATSIDNVTADKVWATTHTKQVIVNGLENGMHLWLYDATGKLLYNEPTSNYQHTYLVPQTGTYFVSVMNGNQKQTIKVVVE